MQHLFHFPFVTGEQLHRLVKLNYYFNWNILKIGLNLYDLIEWGLDFSSFPHIYYFYSLKLVSNFCACVLFYFVQHMMQVAAMLPDEKQR